MKGLIGSQNGTNIRTSVPISVQVPPTNLHTSVVDFIYFRQLVESPLKAGNVTMSVKVILSMPDKVIDQVFKSHV